MELRRDQLETKAKAKVKVKDTGYTISRYSFGLKQFKVYPHNGYKDLPARLEIEQKLLNLPTHLLLYDIVILLVHVLSCPVIKLSTYKLLLRSQYN